MKYFIIAFLCCLLTGKTYCQNNPEDIEFIKSVVKIESSAVYSDSFYKGMVEDMRKILRRDTIISKELILTSADRLQINYALAEMDKPIWKSGLFDNTKMMSGDTIENIFKDREKGWDFFYKHYGNKIYSFSKPIFLRDHTICFFYQDYGCGWLCAQGEFAIYRKRNGKWEKWRTLLRTIS